MKYFASFDYVYEGDLYKFWDNNRGYKVGYNFNRLNVRSNLDFSITKTTNLRVNLFGSQGVRKGPNDTGYLHTTWLSIYGTAPDAMLPRYSDGTWGYYRPDPATQLNQNSVETMALKGIGFSSDYRINTDFQLDQDLGMILKGLRARLLLSYDNAFSESGRGINDIYNASLHKWVDPDTGIVYYDQSVDSNNKFDFQEGIRWSTTDGSASSNITRRMYYSVQLNWARRFGQHNITAMGDFNREESARGSTIPNYRENWVFRTTYDYGSRYLFEYNGAYNGSEKFAPAYRFGFFQSGAIGWNIAEEPFFKSFNIDQIIDQLKVRASYGQIGDDNVSGDRWLYMTTWAYTGRFRQGLTGVNGSNSPYTWYRETNVGNPAVQWEVVTKSNLGVDYSFLSRVISGSVEFFKDQRRNVFMRGSTRSVPSYYGASPPAANLGAIDSQGFEIELRLNKRIRDWRLHGTFTYTHAEDKVLERDDPELYADYRKQAGFANNQSRYYVDAGYINNFDELYGQTAHDQLQDQRKPGDYIILDYDADGIISSTDRIPYSYTGRPQNTINFSIGADYKAFSFIVQFYGVNNVDRDVSYESLGGRRNTVFDEGTYWSKENQTADVPLPRWFSQESSYARGTRFLFDASYLRLRNMELAYNFSNQKWLKSLGVNSLRIYLNGNNLWLFTHMPDDRESNFGGTGASSQGAYPTVKRFNLGFRLSL